jgi:shikimate kinase
MILFLIGPSGVGKTTLAKAIADGSQFIHINLDLLVSNLNGKQPVADLLAQKGKDWLWQQYKKVIDENVGKYKFYSSVSLLDVGAVALQSEEARAFLKNQTTVLVTASLGDAFVKDQSKRGNKKIGYMDYEQNEFSPQRMILYGTSKLKIDVSDLTDAEAAEKFKAEMIEFCSKPKA